VTIWWLIRLRLAMWVLKAAGKVTRWAVAAAVLVALPPVTLVTVTGLAGAWLRGAGRPPGCGAPPYGRCPAPPPTWPPPWSPRAGPRRCGCGQGRGGTGQRMTC
jgi:hypothetical protein